MKTLIRYCGISILFAGLFLILTNIVFSSLIYNPDSTIVELTNSSIFKYRMIFALTTGVFLVIGSIGIHLNQINEVNKFGHFSFFLALIGSVFHLSNEWYQLFIFPELALNNPQALLDLDTSETFSRYDIGAMIAILTFTLGWISFSTSMIMSKVYPRTAPVLIISDFFITPIFSAIISPIWGTVTGNSIMGLGFCYLGKELLFPPKKIQCTNQNYDHSVIISSGCMNMIL